MNNDCRRRPFRSRLHGRREGGEGKGRCDSLCSNVFLARARASQVSTCTRVRVSCKCGDCVARESLTNLPSSFRFASTRPTDRCQRGAIALICCLSARAVMSLMTACFSPFSGFIGICCQGTKNRRYFPPVTPSAISMRFCIIAQIQSELFFCFNVLPLNLRSRGQSFSFLSQSCTMFIVPSSSTQLPNFPRTN